MDEELTQVARELSARMLALQAGLIAVIRSHPNPPALLVQLVLTEDAGLANMQYLPWTEDQIDVYRKSVAALKAQIPR